jgi:hypothetical protein
MIIARKPPAGSVVYKADRKLSTVDELRINSSSTKSVCYNHVGTYRKDSPYVKVGLPRVYSSPEDLGVGTVSIFRLFNKRRFILTDSLSEAIDYAGI